MDLDRKNGCSHAASQVLLWPFLTLCSKTGLERLKKSRGGGPQEVHKCSTMLWGRTSSNNLCVNGSGNVNTLLMSTTAVIVQMVILDSQHILPVSSLLILPETLNISGARRRTDA